MAFKKSMKTQPTSFIQMETIAMGMGNVLESIIQWFFSAKSKHWHPKIFNCISFLTTWEMFENHAANFGLSAQLQTSQSV